MTEDRSPHRVVGVSERRVGGYERVTGRQQFVGDVRLEDVLHV
ncbi:MAG: hypothetical protein JWO15_3768 [Sphingomonadales bacterium]|nr:hypothetical protein [Sphingomonadales bacterium]